MLSRFNVEKLSADRVKNIPQSIYRFFCEILWRWKSSDRIEKHLIKEGRVFGQRILVYPGSSCKGFGNGIISRSGKYRAKWNHKRRKYQLITFFRNYNCETTVPSISHSWQWHTAQQHTMHCFFSTATMVTRTRHDVTLYKHCLSVSLPSRVGNSLVTDGGLTFNKSVPTDTPNSYRTMFL